MASIVRHWYGGEQVDTSDMALTRLRDINGRRLRAIEFARKKAAGMSVQAIARMYRVGRTTVYDEIASLPPDIRERCQHAPTLRVG